ncbi:MAG: RdgB/HAM1 family non-canonical purine NTP pyrophosphatase [Muribaculaceae bacterium]|nr:RdgB/HAM1 family non-canonical purine NTP pyrophosphatase [Muribaculaceae bacterium]
MKQPRTIVFASHNSHKVEEMRRICGPAFNIVSLADIGCHTDIPEEGATLAENAEAKAMWVYRHYGLECFADDTGLEVDALDGAPGVHTARFAGPECDSAANVDLLLHKLCGARVRTARFRTVIAHVSSDGDIRRFDGVAEGSIATERLGSAGFGYDPVFVPAGHTRSFAQMAPDEKNAISHRGRATALLKEFLNNL